MYRCCKAGFASLFCLVAFSAPTQAKEIDYSLYVIADAIDPSGEIFRNKELEEGSIYELRRFKGGIKVPIIDQLEFKFSTEWDTDESTFEVDDFYLEYELESNAKWEFLLGQFKEAFGMENAQSVRDLYVFERSAVTDILTFGRQRGLGIFVEKDGIYLQMAYMYDKNDDADPQRIDSFSSRAFYAKQAASHKVLHFGLSYSGRYLKEENYQIDGPLISNYHKDQIKSAKYDSHAVQNIGAEAALQYEDFLVQSERVTQVINEQNGRQSSFHGFYLNAAWNIFGKKRDYDDGEFEIDKDDWQMELAYRYTKLNLTAGIKADQAEVHEIALNNYFAKRYRFSVQYSYTEKKDWSDAGYLNVEDGSALGVRLQAVIF